MTSPPESPLTRSERIRTLPTVMLRQTAHIIAVLLGVLGPAIALDGAQPAAPAAADTRILILRSGQTFEGRVTQVEGGYVVDFSDGQIRVKASDVDLVCTSLEDGYRQKASALAPGNVQHHLELAQWCMKHKLMRLAAIELANATVIEPNNPAIGVLQHRLRLAQEPPPLTSPADRPKVGPSNDELDRMVRGLPRDVVETFTQTVQPVLMNHCASGGCHGPESKSSLRLFRVSSGKAASRRVTQRNLYAVLPLVDRDEPAASRLLTAANGPHGTLKQPVFDERQAAQYQRMVDWAVRLAGHAVPESPATVQRTAAFESSSPASVQNPPQVLARDARRARPLSAQGETHNVKRGAADTSAVLPSDRSADPFDPEIFNRRFAPKTAAERESTAAASDAATAKRP